MWWNYLKLNLNYQGQLIERWTSFRYCSPGHLQEELHLLLVSELYSRPDSLPICTGGRRAGWPWRWLSRACAPGWLKRTCQPWADSTAEVDELLGAWCLQLLLHPAIKLSLSVAVVLHVKLEPEAQLNKAAVRHSSLWTEPKWKEVQGKWGLGSLISMCQLASCADDGAIWVLCCGTAVKTCKCKLNRVPLLL